MRLAYKKVDTSGRPLAGVEFSLINAATNVVTEVAASDENGEFIFRHIDYGDWIIRETAAPNGYRRIHFNEVETLKSYEKLVVRAYDCAGNFSEAVTLKNPYYGQATSKPTTVPTATPRPASKPTQKPGNSGSGSGNGTSGGGQATSQPTALPTFVPTVMPTLVPTLMPTFVQTAEPTAQPTAMPEYIQTGPGQAFTGSGNMHTLDVLYSAHTN